MNEFIATNVRTKRLEKGYKQDTLALECKMSQANLSHIERGKTTPSEKTMEKIAKSLETTAEALKYGVRIEHNNETQSNNNSKNGVFLENLEKECQQWQEINKAKDETIKSQKIAINLLQAEVERLQKMIE
jgi:transcriptional regulator with XRE-family HTH domain